jgi:hypothetical protein
MWWHVCTPAALMYDVITANICAWFSAWCLCLQVEVLNQDGGFNHGCMFVCVLH